MRQVLVTIASFGLWLTADLNALELTPDRVAELQRLSQGAIVKIQGNDKFGSLVGTGFFIDSTGTILTSYSVGGDATDLEVTAGPVRLPAQRIIADARTGLAFLKVNAITPFLDLSPTMLDTGAEVVGIGFPMGGDLSAQSGRVVGREIRNGSRFLATTHLRALIQALPGMGGAPLLDAKGRVSGVVISKTESSLGCFALPGRAALKLWGDQLRFGEFRHGWMGVELEDIDPASPNPIARIRSIAPDGPASSTGLMPGDLVTKVGETVVINAFDILDASFFLRGGEDIAVDVTRDGKSLSFQITAGDPPSLNKSKVSSLPDKTPLETLSTPR
jgi:serine protease Do